MLTELCQEIRNWFDRDQPHFTGDFTITNGKITDEDFISAIQDNQYFRIVGSVFNDGVYQFTDSLSLINETFSGSVNLMAIPKVVLDLSNEIDAWITKYGDVVSSPFNSESFGGYSYSKATGGSSNDTGLSWQNAFASKLNRWRKI